MNEIGELWLESGPTGFRIGCGEPLDALPAVAATVRQRVRFDANGRYRPLTGARNLPRNWFVEAQTEGARDKIVETVYPLALAHRREFAEGTLRIVTLEEVLTRQSGRYENAADLSPEGRERVRRVLCHDWCVRTPVWAGEQPPANGIPCPEPCSVFVALAREAAQWEANTPESAAIDDTVEFADFESPGNRIRETYLGLLREDGP